MKNHEKFGTLDGMLKENRNTRSNKQSNDYFENKLINFFDLQEFKILNPYNFKAAIERIENLTEEEILNDLDTFAVKEFDYDYNQDSKFECSIEEMYILTAKNDENKEFNKFIKLVDFKDYLNESQDKPIIFRFFSDERRKEISLKSCVDFEKISENFSKIFHEDAVFDSSKNLVKIAQIQFTGGKNKKTPEVDIIIKQNSVKRIFQGNDERSFILELQHPPLFKSNFLKKSEKQWKNLEFENVLFPFRNFEHEIANLKFRKFYLFLRSKVEESDSKNKKENSIPILNNFCNLDNKLKSYCSSILKNNIIEKLKYDIVSESEFRSQNKFPNLELNEYFNPEIFEIFQNDFRFQEMQFISFVYQLYVLVSENILTYFNAIGFIEEILNYESKNYFKHKFDNEGFLDFIFTEAITKLIDYQKDSELTIKEFEKKLKENYDILKIEYNLKGTDRFKRKNQNLIKSMRVIVTPTYTLFMPFIEDQGNRILREFCKPTEAMRLVFKMDDYQDPRWNNRFLMEFIKYILYHGIKLGTFNYQFFCYSQSQFRNLGCWLVTNPDEIIPKTGDYSNIKIVAKYGSRIGLTLTSTIKTISISDNKIKYIDDVKDNLEKYVFSDGVGTISYDLAEKIAKKLQLEEIPAAFQARFMGCKGVWTVLFDDFSGEISIRPSQEKFKIQKKGENNFEVCSYSKFVKSYLNRQIILLLGSLGIPDEIFIKKLSNYRNRLEDEKFILSLIQYEEWNGMFMQMHLSGINRSNDRLVRSIVSSNKEILYRDLKKKARIYIEEGAYVMGIMDEFGILEYGEAFLRISYESIDITLDKACSVAKCPCLHPGDIRKLNFVKYHPNKEETKKYQIFERYKNVLIFPRKGKRPHTNEISGSDLDGDQFYIFYDSDLCNVNTVEPMDYAGSSQVQVKDKITRKDVIDFFAEYNNTNNLGLIADAHLAHSDINKEGPKGDIPKILADKFSKAVDAPKTGDMISLEEDEEAKKYPHYMGKNKNTYHSHHVLGKLYDMTQKYTEELDKFNQNDRSFYDEALLVKGYENFIFEGLIYLIEYFEEMLSLLKKNEIQTESELLTGNNIDNDLSSFGKKKHNYDVIERISLEMKNLFLEYKSKFLDSDKNLFKSIHIHNIRDVFQNNFSQRASAFYFVSYNLYKIIENVKKIQDELENYKTSLKFKIIEQHEKMKFESLNCFNYEMINMGYENYDLIQYEESYLDDLQKEEEEIEKLLNGWLKIIENFMLVKTKIFEISSSPNEENQYRILSFPWCTAGNILTKIKELV